MNKRIIIDAIVGKGIGSYEDADRMTKAGYAVFCGNQWNEDWKFDKSVLQKLDEDVLLSIYNRDTK